MSDCFKFLTFPFFVVALARLWDEAMSEDPSNPCLGRWKSGQGGKTVEGRHHFQAGPILLSTAMHSQVEKREEEEEATFLCLFFAPSSLDAGFLLPSPVRTHL